MEDLFFLLGMLLGAGLASFCWWIAYGDRIGTYRLGETLGDRSGWEHDGKLYTPECQRTS